MLQPKAFLAIKPVNNPNQVPANVIKTQANLGITTQNGQYLTTQS